VRPGAATALVLGLWAGAVAAQGAGRGPVRAAADSLAALVAAGDSAWTRGDHPAARAAYGAVVRADSAFSPRALLRIGTLHGWEGRLDEALACHRLFVRLEPDDLDGRITLARTLAWASRLADAVAQYDSVLARDAGALDAVLGKATALAWWGRLDEALALYDSLATAGTGGGRLEAEKGRARVLAWRGDLDLAEVRWRAYLRDHDDDAAAWVGLAQVLRWMGRPFAARDALERALALDPNDRDAREQLRWVRAETRPQAAAAWLSARDSERNTLLQQEVSGTLAVRGNLRVTGTVRAKLVGAPAAADARSAGGTAALQWQPAGTAWTLRGEAGVVEFPAVSAEAVTRARFAARAGGRLGARWRVGAGVAREPLDEVLSSLDAAVSFTGGDVDVSYALRPQLSLGAAASRGAAAGRGVSTDRTTVIGALRWTVTRGVQAALLHREVAWSEPAFGVFFAPQRFAITEASFGWERPRDLGLVASAEVGAGAQAVRFESDPTSRDLALRAAARLGWRPFPGREVIAGFVYANVAGAGAVTASEYSYAAFTLGGRWTF
jgi:tetratricopeptide (TPR) repeat protein